MPTQTRPLRIVLVANEGCVERLQPLLHCTGDLNFLLCHAHGVHEMIPLCSVQEFDLILLDLARPGTPDREPLERVREAFSSVPVVVLVEQSSGSVREEMLRLGASNVLVSSTLTAEKLAATILCATNEDARRATDERALFEQSLDFLQQHRIPSQTVLTSSTLGLKPLSEALPPQIFGTYQKLQQPYRNRAVQTHHCRWRR